ncbi:class I SAM-dependent methyltransferase [Sphingobium sp. YR768]|uniref:class I SAM-dependent methyltransferase n=1 Tax=Sphingobium sp. YR768 TaxID=1884365 RepID=UPI0008C96C69|nr:class I SAM-dependent methyltransferase [Sphingobium sp. YR768]SER25445.1 Methyltransferase domain-containing protein [Sphingobium sp. YR768]
MATDHSQGWEVVADRFIEIRSEIGAELVRSWAQECLVPSSPIVDVGCGSGVPIAKALSDEGFVVFGIDASCSLVKAFRGNLPGVSVACEPAQESAFFGRTFKGAVSIGLIFLLGADDQNTVLGKVASALEPGGRFLFSAPQQACEWHDTLTGRTSLSLGADAYASRLNRSGLVLVRCLTDDAGNNYYDAVKRQ